MPVLNPSSIESILSTEQRASVLHELNAILSGPNFSGSKRCSEFLNFVVRQALDGNFENLTERFVGAELFNRPLDYETATDAIVRVKAYEVRKRLYRHNMELRSASGVQIKLSSGSYVPTFVWPVARATEPPAPNEPHGDLSSLPAEALPPVESGRSFIGPIRYRAAILLSMAVIGSLLWAQSHRSRDNALDAFWKPVFKAIGTVDVRFGDGIGSSYWISPEVMHNLVTHKSLNITADQIVQNEGNQASSGNFVAALSVISLLERHGVPTQIQWPQDFRGVTVEPRSIVYIGAYSNPWTLELNRNLRFSFDSVQLGAVSANGIVDHAVPHQQWPSLTNITVLQNKGVPMHRDYALITRVFDEEHRHVIMAVGGLNQYGTQAAGEFLSDPDAWSRFTRSAPSGWEHKNLQIVLEIDISRGRIVDSRIVATNIW
jgi:hypothetical protein